VIYLDVEDLLEIAAQVLDAQPQVRDMSLLAMSAARPQTMAFGYEPYVTVAEKAAALLVAVCKNHALIDGNKRLALTAAFVFCGLNRGSLPRMTNDEAYDLTMAVATGEVDVKEVAAALTAAGIS
jgi:death-on-curing protein